jgi:chemotaxis protein MotB
MNDLSSPRSASPLPWAVAGAAAVVALAVLLLGWLPSRSSNAELTQRITDLNREMKKQSDAVREKQQAVIDQQQKAAELEKSQVSLKTDLDAKAEQLNEAIREKEALIAELKEAQRDLTSTLGKEIAAGDVLIQERRGELVIDVSDRLLFEEGKTEISEPGKELLKQVAASIKRLPPKLRFQVGGHTDSQRVVSPELVERFPTNWELSTARASNVVRNLQEFGKVPGHKLIAAGFAQYRPASTNNTKTGRQKNRRIEIVVVMPKE